MLRSQKNRLNRTLQRTLVSVVIGALFSFSISPSTASATPCYLVENGVLTNGSGCSGDVVIEDGITAIGQHSDGYGAFQDTGITSISIPSTVTEIMYGAFWSAGALSSVTFAPNSSMTRISQFAFAGTTNLRKITLPSSLNEISSVAFQGSGIRYITFEGAPPTLNNYNGNGGLQNISSYATAWVTPGNFAAFNSQNPTLLPRIRSLTAATPPPSIFSPLDGDTITARVGLPIASDLIYFFGVGNPLLDVSAGSLPPGISINQTGQLVGTPTTTAPLITRVYPVTLRVRDGDAEATVSINFEILPPYLPDIAAETFDGYVGIPANKEISLSSQGDRIVTVEDGSLPPGLSISNTNRIVGTPTTSGTYVAKLRLTDSYSQFEISDDFSFVIAPPISVTLSASREAMTPTSIPETTLYSLISLNAPDDFIICAFYKDAANPGSTYQKDDCSEVQWSDFVSQGISSDESSNSFENMSWLIRVYGPDATAEDDPEFNTPFLATVTVKVGREDLYRNWQTPLSNLALGPKVNETVYASAFERALPRALFKNESDYRTNTVDFPTPEEYVYRITKEANSPSTSVDHQSHSEIEYESLSALEQTQWYRDLGFADGDDPLGADSYSFNWRAFVCVSQDEDSLQNPSGLTISYASREDGILPTGGFNTSHNTMFKAVAEEWHESAYYGQGTRTVVGFDPPNINDPYSNAFLGDADPTWESHIWGVSDVNGACSSDRQLQALRILGPGGFPVTTKSFQIPNQLNLDLNGQPVLVNSVGMTIGVTGGASRREFNAALWGLTTIASLSSPSQTSASYQPAPTESSPVTSPLNRLIKAGTILMSPGSYALSNSAKSSLRAAARRIYKLNSSEIFVHGHESQSRGNNFLLSSKRAKAVADYLRPFLNGRKIVVRWYGSKKPIASGDSAADLAKNRRVEIYAKK